MNSQNDQIVGRLSLGIREVGAILQSVDVCHDILGGPRRLQVRSNLGFCETEPFQLDDVYEPLKSIEAVLTRSSAILAEAIKNGYVPQSLEDPSRMISIQRFHHPST
jgi:hypothetical protein